MSGPGRPATLKTTTQFLNGTPSYLGAIVSVGGEVVNNATTATPFNQTALGPNNQPPNLTNTLAGKMLLLQTSAAGSILFSQGAGLSGAPYPIIALQSVVPPANGTQPGVLIGSGERVIVLVLPTMGWLQWLPTSGAGNIFVWELL